ncbi:MAG: YybH family protein [Gammaproteobacteria bacterium]
MNQRTARLLIICLVGAGLLSLGGCSASSEAIRRAREESILRADRSFAREAVQHGLRQAYHHYFLPDAVLLAEQTRPIRGRHLILERLPAGAGSPLTWFPQKAVVTASGSLGMSWGYYEVSERTTKGHPTAVYGNYVTIWRRSHGHWRVSLEMQNSEPGPGSGFHRLNARPAAS